MFVSEMIEVRGVETHVMTAGEGKPLVWLNGFVDLEKDAPFFKELAEQYKVYLVENPGFGQSKKIDWIKEGADYNYFYRDFLDHYQLDKVNLLGHSIGGRIALEFAISHPQRVEKLLLICPQGAFVENVKVPNYFHGTAAYKANLLWHDKERAQQRIQKELSVEETIVVDRTEAALARLIWERNHNPKFKHLLKYIVSPTSIIWGKEDKLYPVEHGEYFKQNIADSTLTIIEDTGHLPHIEKPEETLEIVKSYLEQTLNYA